MATTAVNPTQNMAPAVAGAPGAVSQPGQAQVPTAPGAANTSVSLSNLSQIMQQPAVRKAMPAIVAFLSVAVFLIAYSWMQDPVYRTVYPGLSESDRQAAFEALAGGDFNARIDSGTGELKVPDGRYHEARIFLASRGLPQEGTNGGISGLSDEASMTSSQFMEQVRYVSAMEQELARSFNLRTGNLPAGIRGDYNRGFGWCSVTDKHTLFWRGEMHASRTDGVNLGDASGQLLLHSGNIANLLHKLT